MLNITKMRGCNGEIEMPLAVFNAYLGYITCMIESSDARSPFKGLIEMLPGEYSDEEKEKWFYQTLAWVAAMKLKRFKK